jgi:signal transduction histidine kinase
MARTARADLLSFRRAFALLIVLVVLPSVGLAGFGVLGIINERAAVEKRLAAAWTSRLTAVAEDVKAALAAGNVEQLDPLRFTVEGAEVSGTSFTVRAGQLASPDARLMQALEPLAAALKGLPTRPVVFSVSSSQGTLMVVVVEREGVVHGARLSEGAIDDLVQRKAAGVIPPSERARFVLKPVKKDTPPEGLANRLASGVAEVREGLASAREIAGSPLPSPLQDFALVAVAEGEDPVTQASTRNRAWYGVVLGALFITLVVGVVYLARTLYREAKLSRLKTDFVSLVSHELRTPLTSIRMFIETLAMGRVRDEAETQVVLTMLSKETERLSAMIENVLDWSRIESGKQRYDLEKVTAAEIVDAAVSAFRTQRMGAPLELVLEVPEGLPALQVDRAAVAGSLLNLLQNAFKYTGDDKRIALKVTRERKGVAISVQDNGVGIARAEQRKVFERFYRIDDLLTRSTEGSGLGLAIAQRIIRAHGGDITLRSELGKGSTFTIHLPGSTAT